jgi:AhpD family alkylhydroperoxidase
MKHPSVEKYNLDRTRLNELVLKLADQKIKRFFSLDSQVYREDALPGKTKEMLGLVASLVLRCDDCIKYHLQECYNQAVSDKELEEVISIGLIVGGSITIPHIRRAVEFWEALKS